MEQKKKPENVCMGHLLHHWLNDVCPSFQHDMKQYWMSSSNQWCCIVSTIFFLSFCFHLVSFFCDCVCDWFLKEWKLEMKHYKLIRWLKVLDDFLFQAYLFILGLWLFLTVLLLNEQLSQLISTRSDLSWSESVIPEIFYASNSTFKYESNMTTEQSENLELSECHNYICDAFTYTSVIWSSKRSTWMWAQYLNFELYFNI